MRQPAPKPGPHQSLALILPLLAASCLQAADIHIHETGNGNEFIGGAPITLPAAQLSSNAFHDGVICIRNRPHCVRPATFSAASQLALLEPASTSSFPAYLAGQPFVHFLQNVRHYTNYSCTVSTDQPATFYLLLDNRLNDFLPGSELNDPSLGPPDTDWVLADGWQRVRTGLSPGNLGDFLAVDEGCNDTPNNFYAIYQRPLDRPGSVTLRTAFEGNIYCLVINTNPPAPAEPSR